MDYTITDTNPEKQRTDCLVVGIYSKQKPTSAASCLDSFMGGYLSQVLKQGDLKEELGSTLLINHPPQVQAKRLLLVHCGAEKKALTPREYQKILRLVAASLKQTQAKTACIYLTELNVSEQSLPWKLQQAALHCADSLYQFTQLKSKPNSKPPLKSICFNVANRKQHRSAKQALQQGEAIAEGIALTKELSNLPANICTPSYLAKQAQTLAKNTKKVSCKILDEAAMKTLKMGALLSVSQGSKQPAKLIVLQYKGAKSTEKPIVLVGKGITFDSGGISLKPGAKMDEMKFDMVGAASLLGTLKSATLMQLPLNITVVIATSENLPGSKATKPGDIVKTMSGQTVEILNTDAEGRLVLCDALTYCKRFNPKVVIDVATLTGAMVVALGNQATGAMGNHPPSLEKLKQAGEISGDRLWPLPLWEEYGESLKSNFADIANIGSPYGGALIAGAFLSKFTEDYHWVHLDIAGTAWHSGSHKGATGRPVPLLTQYLLDSC